jgi:hypothetical protein
LPSFSSVFAFIFLNLDREDFPNDAFGVSDPLREDEELGL